LKLRTQILLFLLLFGLAPLAAMVLSVLPLGLKQVELFYHKAHLQNLRADFRDLDEHLASRHEMVRLLAKLPEPSLILGQLSEQDKPAIDKARVRYTQWINQMLTNHLDINQILFVDTQGVPRFWLELDPATRSWSPVPRAPEAPNEAFFKSAMKRQVGGVSVSKISLNPEAGHPSNAMTLHLVSTIGRQSAEDPVPEKIGAVVVNIDVGGMARAYRNTLWVTNNGSYLQQQVTGDSQLSAFDDFQGLEEIFSDGKLALWEGLGGQVIWVPLFMTEDSGPLWVGRAVDPSPIAGFRNNLLIRVLSIVTVVFFLVLLTARLFASNISRFGQSLTERIGAVLNQDRAVQFQWRGPQEVQELGVKLTELAETHARHAREQREHARQLEDSNRYKSEFLANVSHELRTPLNSILLLSKLLRESAEGMTREQKKQLKVIYEAGADLKELIENILDLSRLEAGRCQLDIAPIDIQLLMTELIELVKPQFDARGLDLSMEVAPDVEREMISDQAKLRQILKNFLSNALKFTPKGKVEIRVYRQPGDQECPLRIAVSDSGIGIPAQKHDIIFEAFRQADGSTNRVYGGTGLGLSISRELASLLGGRIYLQSKEGVGSTFILCLPFEISPSEPMDVVPDKETEIREPPSHLPEEALNPVDDASHLFEGHKLLLVDDDVRSLLVMTPLLERWGLEVLAAGDGKEALETLADEPEIALILMDLVMPELDGYDTIKRIRQDDKYREMPIIALSAKDVQTGSEACLKAGADHYLSKPVGAEELKAVLNTYLR
jgi:signal transduction histidine kinase